MYSLGCTLYALLAGRPPFVEDTTTKLVFAHREKEPTPLHELRPDVPQELSAVAARVLAKDPAKRPQRPIDVARALLPFAGTADGAVPLPPLLVERHTAVGLVRSDTWPEKRRDPEKAKPRPRRSDHDARDAPPDIPAGWWSRPAVIAGAVAVVLVLVAVAGVIVVAAAMMSGVDPPGTAAVTSDPGRVARKVGPLGGAAGNAKTPEQKKDEDNAAAKRKQAEEERQRQEAEKKKAEEAEKDGARRLSSAKRPLQDAEDARRDGNLEEEKRLKDEAYPNALREITKKFRGTKAAKDAQKLLDDL